MYLILLLYFINFSVLITFFLTINFKTCINIFVVGAFSCKVEYLLSRRGKPQLLYKGYLYNRDSFSNGRSYWRCTETRRGTCVSRLITTIDTVYEKQPHHDHMPNKHRFAGKQIITAFEYNSFLLKDFSHKLEK